MRISWGRAGDVKCDKTKQCPSSGHRVNSHHGGWYGAMVWTCAETMLITQGYFDYCSAAIAHQGFSAPHTPWQKEGWGCTKSWEGTQPGQLSPTHDRDLLYYMTSYSANKAGERGRKDGTFGVMPFPKSPLCVHEPCFPGNGWTTACPLKLVTEFLVLLCFCVCLSVTHWSVSASTHEFSQFYSSPQSC